MCLCGSLQARLVAGVNLHVYQLWQLEGVNSCTYTCHVLNIL